MQLWVYDFNIKNTVSAQIGFLQITDPSYVDEEIIDNSIAIENIPIEALRAIENVTSVQPRFSSGALTSTGIKSKYAGLIGINGQRDSKSLKLDRKLTDGNLLDLGDTAILITDKMAEFYKVSVGDSLVMIGSGYRGYTAAGVYRIKGIVDIPNGALSNMVYMDITKAQELFGAQDRYTQVLINIEEQGDLGQVQSEVRSILQGSDLELRTWKEVIPGLNQGLEIDSFSGQMLAGILYMIVGFGIFGTIVMMYNERRFEFGVMSAIGMAKYRMIQITLLELIMLIGIGVLSGIILSLPVLYHFNSNPILLGGESAAGLIDQGFEPYLGMGLYLDVFTSNAAVIAVIALLTSSYMLFELLKLDPIKAMKK
jgi:ABC-type lipoprotein release transport system permease subunit